MSSYINVDFSGKLLFLYAIIRKILQTRGLSKAGMGEIVNQNDNTISKWLFGVGIAILVIGLLIGLIMGVDDTGRNGDFNWGNAFGVWISACTAGLMLVGTSEIIRLLQIMVNSAPGQGYYT